MREKTREERSESTRDGRRSDEGGTATVRAGTHCRPSSASSGGMPNDCATCRWAREGIGDRGGQSRSLAGTDDRVSVDADRSRALGGTTERRISFGTGNAPETRAATRRRLAVTRNDPGTRPMPHQTRRRARYIRVPCPRCTRASGPPWCLTRCLFWKEKAWCCCPRNRPGSAPPKRSRRPRPRFERPSRRLSLRTSENAGRRRRYPRRASRGACFCSSVPTPHAHRSESTAIFRREKKRPACAVSRMSKTREIDNRFWIEMITMRFLRVYRGVLASVPIVPSGCRSFNHWCRRFRHRR